MDDATSQLGNNSTEISNLVSGKNGVRFAIRKMVELPPRGAVIQPLTQFILHFRLRPCNRQFLTILFLVLLSECFLQRLNHGLKRVHFRKSILLLKDLSLDLSNRTHSRFYLMDRSD